MVWTAIASVVLMVGAVAWAAVEAYETGDHTPVVMALGASAVATALLSLRER